MASKDDTELPAAENNSLKTLLDKFPKSKDEEDGFPVLDEYKLDLQGTTYEGFDMVTSDAWKQVFGSVEDEREARNQHAARMPTLQRDYVLLKKTTEALAPEAATVESSMHKLSIDSQSQQSRDLVEKVKAAMVARPGFASMLADEGLIAGEFTKPGIDGAYKVVNKHNDSLQQLVKELPDLKRDLAQAATHGAWGDRVSALETTVTRTLQNYVEERKKWRALRPELQKVRSDLTTLKAQHSSLQQTANQDKSQASQLNQRLTALEAENGRLKSENGKLTSAIDVANDSVQAKTEELRQKDLQLGQANSTADGHRRTADGYRGQRNSLRTQLWSAQSATLELQNTTKGLRREIQDAQNACQEFKSSNEHLISQSASLENRLHGRSLEKCILRVEWSLCQHRLRRTWRELRQANSTTQSQTSELTQLKENLTAAQADGERLTSNLESLQSELDTVKARNTKVEGKIEETRGLIRSRNTELEAVKRDLTSQNSLLQQTESARRAAVQEAGQLQTQLTSAQTSDESRGRRITRLEQRLESRQQDLDQCRSSLNTAENSNGELGGQIDELEDQVSKSNTKLQKSEEGVSELREQVEGLNGKVSHRQRSLEQLQGWYDALKQEAETTKASLDSAKNANEQLQRQVQQDAEELCKRQGALDSAKSTNQQLQNQAQQNSEDLSGKRDFIRLMTQQKEHAESRVTELEQQVTEKGSQYEQLRLQLAPMDGYKAQAELLPLYQSALDVVAFGGVRSFEFNRLNRGLLIAGDFAKDMAHVVLEAVNLTEIQGLTSPESSTSWDFTSSLALFRVLEHADVRQMSLAEVKNLANTLQAGDERVLRMMLPLMYAGLKVSKGGHLATTSETIAILQWFEILTAHLQSSHIVVLFDDIKGCLKLSTVLCTAMANHIGRRLKGESSSLVTELEVAAQSMGVMISLGNVEMICDHELFIVVKGGSEIAVVPPGNINIDLDMDKGFVLVFEDAPLLGSWCTEFMWGKLDPLAEKLELLKSS